MMEEKKLNDGLKTLEDSLKTWHVPQMELLSISNDTNFNSGPGADGEFLQS